MTSQSYESNRDWEKMIQQKLNKIYVERFGEDVISRRGERGYDLMVRDQKTLQQYAIEEKIIRNIWANLSVEIIQDLRSCNLGWIYKCGSYVFRWVMCQGDEPKVIYEVYFQDFKKWYLENCKNYSPNTFRIEPEGWGITLHQLIPPQDIPNIKEVLL